MSGRAGWKDAEKAALWRAVGERVRSARTTIGLTQAQLAREVGMPRPSLTLIEQGYQGLSLYEACRLARELGCKVHELLPVDHLTLEQTWRRKRR